MIAATPSTCWPSSAGGAARATAACEHPDWDAYRAAMQRERRVLIRIPLDHAGPDQHG